MNTTFFTGSFIDIITKNAKQMRFCLAFLLYIVVVGVTYFSNTSLNLPEIFSTRRW